MKNINCPNCQELRQIHAGKYHYTESGLQNVWLVGVEIFECDCGEKFAILPCLEGLHKVIAKILLTKEDQLTGREIRFLRKHMGLKAKDFAKHIGVMNVTVSRWEREETIPPTPIDRLIRFFYATEMKLFDFASTIKIIKFRKHIKGQKESPINIPIERIKKQDCVVHA
ncbi:MAG: type II TA system antitoxin MqsA family protein [Desulfobaccales bacterium]